MTLAYGDEIQERTSRFTLRSSVNVWLNAETGAINKSMFTAEQAPYINGSSRQALKRRHFYAHRHRNKVAMPLS